MMASTSIKDFRALMICLKTLTLVLEMDTIIGEEAEVLSFHLEEGLMISLMRMMMKMTRKMTFSEEDLSLVALEIHSLVMTAFILVDIEMTFTLKIMGIDSTEMSDIQSLNRHNQEVEVAELSQGKWETWLQLLQIVHRDGIDYFVDYNFLGTGN